MQRLYLGENNFVETQKRGTIPNYTHDNHQKQKPRHKNE